MLSLYCPNCGKPWHYYRGACEVGPGGQQLEPDEGYCEHCGFQYQQHCEHPLVKQLEKFAGTRLAPKLEVMGGRE